MIGRIVRAFQPLDTSEVEHHLSEMRRTNREVLIRTVALQAEMEKPAQARAVAIMAQDALAQSGDLLRAAFGDEIRGDLTEREMIAILSGIPWNMPGGKSNGNGRPDH